MRVAVVVDGPRVARWKYDCVALLQGSCEVRVYDLGRGDRNCRQALARRLFGGVSLRPVPVASNGSTIDPCDVILDMRSSPASRPPIGQDARYWCFCDSAGVFGELPGASEIAAGSPTFTLELREVANDGSAAVLRWGKFKALYAYARSLDVALEECKRWPSIALTTAAAGKRFESGAAALRTAAPSLAMLALELARAFLAHAFAHLFLDARWSVGLIRGRPESFLTQDYRPRIEWLRRSRTDFLADPFLLDSPDGRFILGERLDSTTRTGFISCLEVDQSGNVLSERAVMRSRSHLSYPYVFAHEGAWYMVPESAQEKRVTLYRALEAPYDWKAVATLIEGVDACDNTLVQHDGRWWLFCTHKSRDASLNLFLYHARELTGPWQPHPANPVKTDVGSSRPAGTPFVAGGQLYRPAQDCTRSYGDGITFNRITSLTERSFSEETVTSFHRDAGNAACHGAHTLSYCDDLMAIDSKTTIVASPKVIRARLAGLVVRAASLAS
ncbi:MAG TPA: hypothetical protein VGX91_08685 [Candidatus Cybelea sp.]|nr:hypothetical protein [Candidatus Cybelea sp.]